MVKDCQKWSMMVTVALVGSGTEKEVQGWSMMLIDTQGWSEMTKVVDRYSKMVRMFMDGT